MKRKVILTMLVLVLFFAITGCGKNKGLADAADKNSVEQADTSGDNSSYDDIELYSDSTKYVFELSNTKYVFYYSGDTITAYHTYVDYNDAATAKTAYQLLKLEDYPEVNKYYVKGKYIVFEWNKSQYEDMTVSELKTAYSYMKELKKSN